MPIPDTVTAQQKDNIAYFIAFCLETYKHAHGMKGADAAELFSRTGLVDFLAENFEAIHSQSPQWILEEINDYLSTRSV